jgi:hypothetical protein
MLQFILDDLLREREALCEALRASSVTQGRTDFVDCWNLLDEIGEQDRRIATLMSLLGPPSGDGRISGASDGLSLPSPARARPTERAVAGRPVGQSAACRPDMGRRRLPRVGRR